MTDKRWEFELDQDRHTVELEHNTFSNKQSIRVDGRLLSLAPESQQVKERSGKQAFRINGHACEVRINYQDRKFAYDLLVDGVSNVPEKYALELSQTLSSPDTDKKRKIIVNLFIWSGLGLSLVSWVMAHTLGYYQELLVAIGPAFAFIGIYFLVFPEDFVQQYTGKFSVRMWIANALAFLLGFANLYAFSHGLY